ncbi:MAG: hypothetical protein LBK74_01750 [Treponema sp.]|jgi:hypothetical protein|nr:hypothetical protein [Treponema sp.]
MKKLFILLLCLVAFAGLVSAGAIHPPEAPAPEMALSGYGAGYEAVTPDTVLVTGTPFLVSDQILVVPDILASGLPRSIFGLLGDPLVVPDVPVDDVGYPLRL